MTSAQLLFLLQGARGTLILTALTFISSAICGFAVAIAYVSENRLLSSAAKGYVTVMQGSPILVLMGIAFYTPTILFDVHPSPLAAAVVALTLNSAAFLGDIWRGCIQSVPKSQWESATCLSLSRLQRMVYIILPQAYRIAIPPTVGFMVQVVKYTSYASLVVGYSELTFNTSILNNSTFEPFLYFGLAALVYFIFCYPLSRLSIHLEHKLAKRRRVA